MMCNFKTSVQLLIGLSQLFYAIQCESITEIVDVYPDLGSARLQETDPITMVFKDAVVPLDADYSTTEELVFTAGDSLYATDLPM